MDALIAHMKVSGWNMDPKGLISHPDQPGTYMTWLAAIMDCVSVASGG